VPENLKTEELWSEVSKNCYTGGALELVPEELKTYEFCLEMVKDSGGDLEFVPEHLKTAEICLEAVKNSGYALEYVPENLKTAELCWAAVKQREEWARSAT